MGSGRVGVARRASSGRPWIFKEVKHYIETGEELPPLSFDWKMDVLRREVSMVLQKNVLFSGTILDNLHWGDEDASEEECIRVAKLACAETGGFSARKGIQVHGAMGFT